MTAGRWRQLVAGAAVLMLAGCSGGPDQCGPCAQPGRVHVSGVSSSATALRVCVGHDPCVVVDLTDRLEDGGRVQADLSLQRRPAEYDGVMVRVTATDPSGTRRAQPRPMVWDDPDGECACSTLDARLRLRPVG